MYPSHSFSVKELQKHIAGCGILTVPQAYNESYFSPLIRFGSFITHHMSTKYTRLVKINGKDHFTEKAIATSEVNILPVCFYPVGMHQLFRNDMTHLTNTYKLYKKAGPKITLMCD